VPVRWRLSTLLLLCFFTFFLGLGSQAITDADEAFYAEASREMVESGDWLTPRFNYQNRWEKPVLYYWLTAATYLVTGPTELAARFWSAMSGVGLALLGWAIARHMIGRLDAAWLAGAIVATSFGYFALARAALPDLPLAFFITLGVWSALRAADTAGTPASLRWWMLSGLGAGSGFLMKGPVALVVLVVVMVPIAWRERRRLRLDARGMAMAVVIAAAIGLPWYIAMWREHGNAYLQSFFVADNFERFTTERFNDARPFWFYLPMLLGGLLPWSVYLVAICGDGLARARRKTLRLDDADWRLLLWAVMPVVFFTLSVGKQPRYILPVLPPLAVVVARGVIERVAHDRDRLLSAATWITAVLYAALVVILVRMEPVFITAIPLGVWIGLCLIGCAAIALAGIAASSSWRLLPHGASVAAVLVLVSVWFGALAGNRPEAVEQMAALIHGNRTSEQIGVLGVFTRNLGFYTAAPRVELFDVKQASDFIQSPQRVLLVLRSTDVAAVEAASRLTLTKLGETRYLNTANIRLRTLMEPDPTREIEMISLVSNR
jgi:4-amino-4-deoxy-L-arabinose transferase